MYQNITMTISDNEFVISNPGGLYGISISELGHTGSKTRNTQLTDICQFVPSGSDNNVIERLGSGIPKVLEILSNNAMQKPLFIDGGIYFTAKLFGVKDEKTDEERIPLIGRTPNNTEKVVNTLIRRPMSRSEIEIETNLTKRQVQYALSKLVSANKIRRIGEPNSPTLQYAWITSEGKEE
jgi:ATP-dependent DNA helicase RecG